MAFDTQQIPSTSGRDSFEPRCVDLPTTPRTEVGTVLVTGASGYVGGRLVPELVTRGYRVRAMIRGNETGDLDSWPEVEIVVADALDPAALARALEGVSIAYYLIHSMVLGPREFARADLQSAHNFREAAQDAGVERIIYLGGLGAQAEDLSHHLDSRRQVAEELANGSVPCTIIRASIIIGSGSASFEIIKGLVDRLPLIPFPTWADNLGQPIGIRDVLKYLVGVLEVPLLGDRTFDIGGLEVLTYRQMMGELASILGKRTRFVPAPIRGTKMVAYAISLLTPVPAPISICLTDGLKSDTVCDNNAIQILVPFTPISYREALVRALSVAEQDCVATRWSDAYPPAHELSIKLPQLRRPPRYRAAYSRLSDRSASALFRAITRIGGHEGWFNANWMWRLRGAFDRAIFGVGTARGRRSARGLRIGDVIDFWRVEELQPDRRLLLRAEMRMPGRAWLEFDVKEEQGRRRLGITAHYATKSLFGNLYWRFFQPFHWYIFEHLLRQIEGRSQVFDDPTFDVRG
ncbi:MAG: SDR family oxidoreductase [bacterium]|nr:SDR family oxidoreductase [bacterium]